MEVLLAVIDDLFQFTRCALFGVLVHTDTVVAPVQGKTIIDPLSASNALHTQTPEYFPTSILNAHTFGGQYFIGEVETYLYQDPVVSFDTALERLVYGDLVQVVKLGGRWAHVRIAQKEGWIFKDVLRDKAADVFPSFAHDVVYTADDQEVIKLRMCIADMFKGAASASVLTDAEYVTYKLYKKGKRIPWGDLRPRVAGTWQVKLKGKQGVHIGIKPKNESVMEYIIEDIGHLGFVEAVFPDDSIKLSSIGLDTEGMFTEQMISKDQWKELRPVFIHVL